MSAPNQPVIDDDAPTTTTASSSGAKRWLWTVSKWLLAAVILFAVGQAFARDLARLPNETLSLRPGWIVLSGLLYLVGFGFSGFFWLLLLRRFDQRPDLMRATRAYYIGHLGKYVPGKALAVLLRATLVRSPNVRLSVAILAALYEVLTMMAAGAMLAAIIFAIWPPVDALPWNPVLTGLLLAGLAGIPLLPAVFNRIVARVSSRIQGDENPPRLGTVALLQGLAMTTVAWIFLGVSTWALLNGVLPETLSLDGELLLHLTATVALAYVAGFLAIFVPGGLGVREGLLLALLTPLAPQNEALVALSVLLLRIVWTASEAIAAGAFYLVKPPKFAENLTSP